MRIKAALILILASSCGRLLSAAFTLTMGTGNTFGRLFRISTWGESHGGGVGVVLDGCPPRIPLSAREIQFDLDRRRPGQSRITTPRSEADEVEIVSGLSSTENVTLGTPIAMLVRNKDQRSQDYLENDMKVAYRPSHADATYDAKYGVRAVAGGGRSSARETIGRVAAGAIARKILKMYNDIEVLAYVSAVQDIKASNVDGDTFTMEEVDANMVRCPDEDSANAMLDRIDTIRKAGNSIGGVVTCVARNVPAGVGSPVFDKLEADLAKAMMSIPAAKGFESGDGFAGTLLTGKDHNDEFYIDPETGATRTKTNRSGGIQGGISNGENIVVHVAFKPTSTIGQPQVRSGNGVCSTMVSPPSCSCVSLTFLILCFAGHSHERRTGGRTPRQGASRSLRLAPCRAHGGSHDGTHAGRSHHDAAGPVRALSQHGLRCGAAQSDGCHGAAGRWARKACDPRQCGRAHEPTRRRRIAQQKWFIIIKKRLNTENHR